MSRGAAAPLLARVAVGDIAAAHASLLVVSHLNGLTPSGAEAALDRALAGAISRRAAVGALDGPFGAAHFIPAAEFAVAADAALIVSLGEPGPLDFRRLPEIGAAIIDAAVVARTRDLATVVHGAGGLGRPVGEAARLLATGLLAALARVGGDRDLREIQLVVRSPRDAAAVHRALANLELPDGIVIDTRTTTLPTAASETASADAGSSEPVHVAVTRTGQTVKVTLITDSAFDHSDVGIYPADAMARLLTRVDDRVLCGRSGRARIGAMREIGETLHATFLARNSEVDAALRAHRGGYVLLRLDESTVDLPWELLRVGREVLSVGWHLARQREITDIGHPAAYAPERDHLHALVVGDPRGDLPGARAEANHVAATLRAAGASVDQLDHGTTHKDVLDAIDDLNPDVLHYAGHASFDSLRQQAGGLMLADGCLTGEDMAARRHVPRLVFANGCKAAATGDAAAQRLSDGAAATGDFAGAILHAGARALVGSQWLVNDEAARTFAEAFYSTLTRSRDVPIGHAVAAGRAAVLAKHGREEPAWGAYALYGAPWKPVR